MSLFDDCSSFSEHVKRSQTAATDGFLPRLDQFHSMSEILRIPWAVKQAGGQRHCLSLVGNSSFASVGHS